MSTTPNVDPATTTIGELRKQFGPHFAKPHQDSDTLALVLAHAGVATLDEYLARFPQQR